MHWEPGVPDHRNRVKRIGILHQPSFELYRHLSHPRRKLPTLRAILWCVGVSGVLT
jgi:hypothetical protein